MTNRPTIPAGYRPYGYNNAWYLPALKSFCEERGYRVHRKFVWACLRRLQNPSHTCTRCESHSFSDPYYSLLDHFILLKAVDDSHWAYLGQPYYPDERLLTAAKELCCSGQCNTFEHIDHAPYGFGTSGILLIGNTKQQMWPRETKAIMRERIEALEWADIRLICSWDHSLDVQPQSFDNKLSALTYRFVEGINVDSSDTYIKYRSNEILTMLIERRMLFDGVNYDGRRNPQVTR